MILYDIVVIGAGPAGSAAAAWLAKAGCSVALLERHTFPRDKVCGDGLTPQALWWINQLGCLDEVLAGTACAITSCDLYINKRKILTSTFSGNSVYPPFCTILDRSKLDSILANHAKKCGAKLFEDRLVKDLELDADGVTAVASDKNGTLHRFKGKIVIGADGAGSVVSRILGNRVKTGTKALSVRAYFDNVAIEGSQVKVYFDEAFFPGYGWLFADDNGHANAGVGCVVDPPLCEAIDLRKAFATFVKDDLGGMFKDARQVSGVKGGWACFSRPKHLSGERLLLIGDAANMTDPLNGGGIHKAIEAASIACTTAYAALAAGKFDAATLYQYDTSYNTLVGPDWRSAELLLTFAKNKSLKMIYLSLLERIGMMVANDDRFGEFAAGIFSGTTAQRELFSIERLISVLPHDPRKLIGTPLQARALVADTASLLLSSLYAGRSVMASPQLFIQWCSEIAERFLAIGNDAFDLNMHSIDQFQNRYQTTNAGGTHGA